MVKVIGFAQHERGLFDGASGLCKSTLVDRQFVATGIDRFPKPLHAQIGKFFGNRLEALANVVEFSGHASSRVSMFGVCTEDSSSR